jgi:nicotinate phosphoribosyltransferase
MRSGELTATASATLADGRAVLVEALRSLPWEGLALSNGDPALPVRRIDVG